LPVAKIHNKENSREPSRRLLRREERQSKSRRHDTRHPIIYGLIELGSRELNASAGIRKS